MFLYRDGWARGLLAVMMVAGPATGLFAGETPSDEALAKLGLRQAGTIVVLEAESDVHSKATEARQLAREWSNAVMRQRFTVSEKEYQTAIKDLNAETNQFKNELNLTNRMINQLPKYRGRFTTNLAAQQNYDLTMYRTQLQWEISQRSNILNQIKSQPFDPKAKLKVDAEVRDKSEALHQAVLDLRTLVDETSEKYKGLAKNDEVKKLLTSIERKYRHQAQARSFATVPPRRQVPGKAGARGLARRFRHRDGQVVAEVASDHQVETIVQAGGRLGGLGQPVLKGGVAPDRPPLSVRQSTPGPETLSMTILVSSLLIAALSFSLEARAMETAEQTDALVRGNNAFATDLYARLGQGDGNCFFSPLSISTALAMTYAGAEGETARQMAKTLHFDLPADQLHPAFHRLTTDLLSRTSSLPGSTETPDVQLFMANALWSQTGEPILSDFRKRIEVNYQGGIYPVDFIGAAEPARRTINAWVEEQTRDKIKDLLKPIHITASTVLVLTNAIYFKALWDMPFTARNTRPGEFQPSNGAKVPVKMMNQTDRFRYFDEGSFQALELPYKGNTLAMVVFLPRSPDGLAALESSLTPTKLDAWLAKLSSNRVQVSLPKFRLTGEFDLVERAFGTGDAARVWHRGRGRFLGDDGHARPPDLGGGAQGLRRCRGEGDRGRRGHGGRDGEDAPWSPPRRRSFARTIPSFS